MAARGPTREAFSTGLPSWTMVENLHATMYQAMGIAPTQFFLTEKRPVYVTRDGKGQVIHDLYA